MPRYSVYHSVATAASTSVPIAAWQAIATVQAAPVQADRHHAGLQHRRSGHPAGDPRLPCTAAQVGASATPTPSPLDAADAAACFQASTGTYATTAPTVGVTILALAMNQRNTIRWSAPRARDHRLVDRRQRPGGAVRDHYGRGTPTLSINAVIDE